LTLYDETHLNYWQQALSQNPSPAWRHVAAVMLGKLADPASLPFLIGILQSERDSATRAATATALGRIGLPTALDSLTYLMNHDEEPSVRSAARSAIDRIHTKLKLRATQKEKLQSTASP